MHVNYCQPAVMFFFPSSPQLSAALFAEHVEVGTLVLFLRRHGTICSLDHIWKFSLAKVNMASGSHSNLWETCIILSIRLCGSVEELHAVL